MPPSEDESLQHWISSEQLPSIPRQELKPSEADAFLEYLFSTIARRPERLTQRSGCGVARYLKALAWQAKPGKMQRFLDYLAKVVWGMVFQYAPIETASKPATLEFLERHRPSYLSSIDAAFGLEEVLQYIRDAPPASQSFNPPHLRGPHLSVQGSGNPQRANDLSERICAGYYALRRARIRGARGRIAEVLNRRGLRVRVRRSMVNTWSGYEVYERVKQYEDRQRKRAPQGRRAETAKWRDAMVDHWILSYRLKQAWEKPVEIRPQTEER